MTPYQTSIACDGLAEAEQRNVKTALAAAWYNAGFQRSKRLPPLHRVIGDTERQPKSSEEIVRALKMKFGVKNG